MVKDTTDIMEEIMTIEKAIDIIKNGSKLENRVDRIIERDSADQVLLKFAEDSLKKKICIDAVSREEVLDQTYLWSKDEFLRITNPFDYLRKRINTLLPVTPVEKVGHWIPVSERLPESCGMYIVTRKIYDCPDTAPIIMSDESWFDGQNTWHNDNRINHDRRYLSDVIAWMPLPEPYKAEGSEE